MKSRLPKFGRTRDQLLILPAAGFVLGDTDAEAKEIAHETRQAQVSPANAGARQFAKDPIALANQWRVKAEAENLPTRELIIEMTGRLPDAARPVREHHAPGNHPGPAATARTSPARPVSDLTGHDRERFTFRRKKGSVYAGYPS